MASKKPPEEGFFKGLFQKSKPDPDSPALAENPNTSVIKDKERAETTKSERSLLDKAKEKVREVEENVQKFKAEQKQKLEKAGKDFDEFFNKAKAKSIGKSETSTTTEKLEILKQEQPVSDDAKGKAVGGDAVDADTEAGDGHLLLKKQTKGLLTRFKDEVQVLTEDAKLLVKQVKEAASEAIKESIPTIKILSKDFNLESATQLLNDSLSKKERTFWYSVVITELYQQMHMDIPEDIKKIMPTVPGTLAATFSGKEQETSKMENIDYDKLTKLVSEDINKYIQEEIKKDPDSKDKNVEKMTEFLGIAKTKLLENNHTADRVKLIAKGVTCAIAATVVTLFATATLATAILAVGAMATVAVPTYVAANILTYAINPKAHREFIMKYDLPNFYDLNATETVKDVMSAASMAVSALEHKNQLRDNIKATVASILKSLDSWGVKPIQGFMDDYKHLFGQTCGMDRLNKTALEAKEKAIQSPQAPKSKR
jgi:hypothetical protein